MRLSMLIFAIVLILAIVSIAKAVTAHPAT